MEYIASVKILFWSIASPVLSIAKPNVISACNLWWSTPYLDPKTVRICPVTSSVCSFITYASISSSVQQHVFVCILSVVFAQYVDVERFDMLTSYIILVSVPIFPISS